jgi:hypothetical protein
MTLARSIALLDRTFKAKRTTNRFEVADRLRLGLRPLHE